MTDKTFDLVVEAGPNGPGFELPGLAWNGDSPPDVISYRGVLLMKIGRYASPGDRYCYRAAVIALITDDLRLASAMTTEVR